MRFVICCLVWITLTLPAAAQGWLDVTVRLLPDSSFAVVETDATGRKQRHCPYRDSGGAIDVDQLIWVLGRMESQSWIDPSSERKARRILERHYRRCHIRLTDSALPPAVNINDAPANQLVRLPGIGPVLAVRIIEYRNQRAAFVTAEDIMKVEGISRATFMAIRHYIRTD